MGLNNGLTNVWDSIKNVANKSADSFFSTIGQNLNSYSDRIAGDLVPIWTEKQIAQQMESPLKSETYNQNLAPPKLNDPVFWDTYNKYTGSDVSNTTSKLLILGVLVLLGGLIIKEVIR